MAKLFNNIRKKLVSDKPSFERTSNYLKYAIGEIFLVVIGILIAVQINNWNENRKRQILKKEYTNSMIADLKRDTTLIREYLDYNKEQEQMLDSLKEQLNIPTLQAKDLRHYHFKANLSIFTSFTNGTFMALRNSGNLDLYKASIRNRLIALNGAQEEYTNWAKTNMQTFYETLNTYLQSAPREGDQENLSVLPDHLIDQAWDGINTTHYIIAFNVVTGQKRFLLRIYDASYKALIEQTEAVLRALEQDTI